MKAKAPTKEKNVLVNVRREEWRKGEDMWWKLKETHPGRLSYANLLPVQVKLWAKYKTNPKSVIGEPVLIAVGVDGAYFGNFPYPATILKAFEEGGNYFFKCLFHPIQEEEWDGEKVADIRLYQVIPLSEPKEPTGKMEKEIRANLMYANILNTLNNNRNGALATLRKNEASYQSSLNSLQKDVVRYQRLLDETEDKLKKTVVDSMGVSELQALIDQLKTHKKIEWAFLGQDGNLYFQTYMLCAMDPKTNKEDKRKPVGRFAMCINPVGYNVTAWNLDYAYQGQGHPNLEGAGGICLGSNGTLVANLAKEGRFFELADFMILFFSLFPHDTGSPYVPHMEWLAGRNKSSHMNPWKDYPKLYEVKGEKEDAPSTIRVKKKKQTILKKVGNKIVETVTGNPEEKAKPVTGKRIATIATPVGKDPDEEGEYCDECDHECDDCPCETTYCDTCECGTQPCPTCDCQCDDCSCEDEHCDDCGCGENTCDECGCHCEDCPCDRQLCASCECGEDAPF